MRTICKINLTALENNFHVMQQYAGSCRLMPVLKYDGYGLGALPIGKVLKGQGAYRFAAATLAEALEIKTLGLDVQILGLLPPDEVEGAVQADLICPAQDLPTARAISAAAVKAGKTIRLAVKIDTGMGRAGFLPEEALSAVKQLAALPNLKLDSLYSHCATAAKPVAEYAAMQVTRFLKVYGECEAAGLHFEHRHLAAGDAVLKVPAAVQPPFNLARPGGTLYGGVLDFGCRQVPELTTTVGAVRLLKKGESTGYHCLYTADRDRRVGLLTAGYADGVPVAVSNRGHVIVRGHYCPILGRVSMDYTVVDLTEVPDALPGDEAVLLGERGKLRVTVPEWAEMKQVPEHDIWCSIGHRVPRIYVRD